MVTAILRSHDYLQNRHYQDRFHLTPRNPNPRSNTTHPSRRRKRSPTARTSNESTTTPSPGKGLVMGQVKILKRGEKLDLMTKKNVDDNNTDLVLSSTNRLGPDPKIVGKQIKVSSDLYAGSVTLIDPSPPPSSLPFPAALVRDTPTSNLRKLLRI